MTKQTHVISGTEQMLHQWELASFKEANKMGINVANVSVLL